MSFVIHLHSMVWYVMLCYGIVRYRSAASFVWPPLFVCLCQNYCTHQILPFHHEYRIKCFGFCLAHAKRVEPASKAQFSSKQLQIFTVDRLHARCIRLPTKWNLIIAFAFRTYSQRFRIPSHFYIFHFPNCSKPILWVMGKSFFFTTK